ncbi:FHA domain-containing protein [Nostocoides sp. F2B08]|uniref:FHA domain-containing protein n=1 Tax=Nostocoides sp. F2B08 TaxID=2653936 RepID=UPI00126380C6|nr:FHA domain-containing protein [Tetrasphaera sp. F2B08]KAB7741966.1 FHA domain-containing protein [Tetrasphaera sp. F2B08]
MTADSRTGDPVLVVLAPDRLRGQRISLPGTQVVIGRAEDSDVRIDDPYVSRSHAVVRRQGAQVLLEDLGSRAGTAVNGHALRGAVPLAPGDLIKFADVEMRFDADSHSEQKAPSPENSPPQAPMSSPVDPPADAARFDVRDQRAGVISNVGRDQRISYVSYVRQERASFLREIAATKTRARFLVWTGLIVFTIGFAMAGFAVLQTLARINDALGDPSPAPPDFSDFYGTPILGIPSGLLGFGLSGIGSMLLVFGIALHVVASARRRRLDRELPQPHPAPW